MGLQLALCDQDLPDVAHLALCKALLTADEKPPEWVELIPGGTVNALDGRVFENVDPEAVVAAFTKDPRDYPVDWEHSTQKKAIKGENAPAAGWITAMEVRDGAIWGHVDWTKRGAESVATKEYRYLSPAFLHDTKKIVVQIISSALTNRPAFDMPALAQEEKARKLLEEAAAKNAQASEDVMDPKLLEMLGLAADAKPEDVIKALAQLKTELATAQADPADELKTAQAELATAQTRVKEVETELTNARAANPELDKFVPRADYDTALARAVTAEKKITDDTKVALAKEIDTELDTALKAGKITPATVEYHKAQCSQEGGLERFKEFAKAAPVIVADSELDNHKPPTGDGRATASAEDLAIAARCGVTKEQYLAAATAQ